MDDGTNVRQKSIRPGISLSSNQTIDYEKHNVVLSTQRLSSHLKLLPDYLLNKLKIERKDLKFYAEKHVTLNPFADVNKYVELYWSKRYKLQQNGDLKALGKLHQEIDRIYACVVGFRPKFAPIEIPLSKFRIQRKENIKALYWNAVAGLVMFAEEWRAQGELKRKRGASVTERWRVWVTQVREQGPIFPEMEAILRFTENILQDWNRFKISWNNPKHHVSKIWMYSGPISKYEQHETPELLHRDAGKEWGPLFGNWEGDAQLIDLVNGVPGWFKIAHRHILERMLRLQYGSNVDLRVLNPDVGGPKIP